MRKIFSVALLLFGVVLLSCAAVFFMVEYIHLTKTLAFLIIGIVMLFIGFIVKVTN